MLLLRKGYQERDTSPRVAVVTKVKGAVAAEAAGRRLWDAADLTWPPQVRLGSGRGQGGHTGLVTLAGGCRGYHWPPKALARSLVPVLPIVSQGVPLDPPWFSPSLTAPSYFPGRKCAFPGDQFHCHNPANPRHLPRGE